MARNSTAMSEALKNVRSILGEESSTEESGNESFRSADSIDQTGYDPDTTTSPDASPMKVRLAKSNRESSIQNTTLKAKQRRKQQTPSRLQKKIDIGIPKAPFGRLIREILIRESTSADRLTVTALLGLQEAAEIYLTQLFQDAYWCTLHRGRVTLSVKDMELTRFLRGVSDPGNR